MSLIVGCGSSSSSYSGNVEIGSVKYHCTSKSAYTKCQDGDCSERTLVSAQPEADDTSSYPDCNITGNTVHVPKNGRCKTDEHKLVCDENGLTMDGGMTSHSGTIQINDTIYQCTQ